MKKSVVYIISSILAISLGLNIYFLKDKIIPSQKNTQEKQIKVTKVVDGDTFDIQDGERIRLYEIDAPEYPKGCMGVDAQSRLETLILNKKVTVEKIKKDNFGRVLAYVYIDKLLLNEVLPEEGLAYFYKDEIDVHTLEIEKAESKAKSAGRGVWSSLCLTQKEGCLIKGNYRSADTTRIYHTPDCYNYNKITIKPGTSDRWFCTEDEAKLAGFTKSQDCPK